jgi:hypothetical protein
VSKKRERPGQDTLTARLKRRFGTRLGTALDPDAIARERTSDDLSKSAILAAPRSNSREFMRIF